MEQQPVNYISKTVLVTGANGYIGRAVAVAFRQKGYQVFGIVRSQEKAKEARLHSDEIIPIIGDPNNPETFQEFIKQAGILVECASSTDKIEFIDNLVKAFANSGKLENGEPKLYIQTVGVKQYPHEHLVLENNDFIGTAVHPSFIYGGQGGPVFKWLLFNKEQEGEKIILGPETENDVWPWCHINDLVRAYVSIAENRGKVKGQVFQIGKLNKEITHEKMINACTKLMNVQNLHKNKSGLDFLLQWNITDFDSERAQKILEWEPYYSCNPLDDLEIHYYAFLEWDLKLTK